MLRAVPVWPLRSAALAKHKKSSRTAAPTIAASGTFQSTATIRNHTVASIEDAGDQLPTQTWSITRDEPGKLCHVLSTDFYRDFCVIYETGIFELVKNQMNAADEKPSHISSIMLFLLTKIINRYTCLTKTSFGHAAISAGLQRDNQHSPIVSQ